MIVVMSVLFLTDVRHSLLWLVVITDIDVDSEIDSVVFVFLSYFFGKKYLLVGASGMLWTGQWVSE